MKGGLFLATRVPRAGRLLAACSNRSALKAGLWAELRLRRTEQNYGGFFTSNSIIGNGIFGQATAASGVNFGVKGKAVSPQGFGVFSEGNMSATGIISGDGSGLTNLNASNLATGNVADARLSGNVGLLNSLNIWTGQNNFGNPANVLFGNGFSLTNRLGHACRCAAF